MPSGMWSVKESILFMRNRKNVSTNKSQTSSSVEVKVAITTLPSPFSSQIIPYIILLVILVVAGFIIFHNIPAVNSYAYASDEGTYFRQATIIKNEGFAGFKTITQSYMQNPQEQVMPNPLRITHLGIAALFLAIGGNSITALSYYSLLTFLALGVMNFIFIKKWWNTEIALISTMLISYLPLTMGLARRALMDTPYLFFATLMLVLFIQFIQMPTTRHYYSFLAILTFTLLFKEITFFILPFFIIALLWLKFVQQDPEISYQHILTLVIVPGSITMTVYLLLCGAEPILLMSKFFNPTHISNQESYASNFCSGPWYEYLVDFFMLSPFISLLFFLYIGYYLLSKERNQIITVLINFLVYFVLVFSLFPKNPRYSINLTFIYTLCASLMLIKLVENYIKLASKRNVILITTTILLCCVGIKDYYKFFIINNIYDPIAFNLLHTEGFIPKKLTSSSVEAYEVMRKVIAEPNEDNYLNLSFVYYKAGNYEDSINITEKIIKLNPQNAVAYNNICWAYGALKQWDKGIEACNKALLISPSLASAKNNLELLQREKAKSQKLE